MEPSEKLLQARIDALIRRIESAVAYSETVGSTCTLCVYDKQHTITVKCGYHKIIDKLHSDLGALTYKYMLFERKAPRLDIMVQMSVRIKRLTSNHDRLAARVRTGVPLVQKLLNVLTDEQLVQHIDLIQQLTDWRTKALSDPVEEEHEDS